MRPIGRRYQEFRFGHAKLKMCVRHLNRDNDERDGFTNLEFRKEVWAGNRRLGIISL